MTVLSVAYPLTEVGPDAVGGSEQILTILDRALVEAGHRSLVLAAEGSRVMGKLIASPRAEGKLDDPVRKWGQKVHRQLLHETLLKYPVDLVHMHSLDFHCYVPSGDVPVLATLHLPADWYPSSIFSAKRRNYYLHCVSSSQRRHCPDSSAFLPVIPNGVDVDRFEWKMPRRGYALTMGRICPEKGFHFALEAAKKARTELIVAGEVFPYDAHQTYFAKEIQPRLDTQRRFIGPIGFAKKKRLLAQAQCLLIPSTVAETSSLVAMEALASGTPVIAFPSGALPEIIEHGRTGYLVSDVKEMARAITAASDLDPEACRDAARTRFSSTEMAERYLNLYDRIVSSKVRDEDTAPVKQGTSWLVSH